MSLAFRTAVAALLLTALLPRPALGSWPTDAAVNLPVCTATGDQYSPVVVTDGAGGAIVVWLDRRNATPPHVYAQRITTFGAAR